MPRSSWRVVLDACVIFSAVLRDTLLRAAEAELYEVLWSEAILEEVRRNLIESGKEYYYKILYVIIQSY
jgi:predicted nucleic acid-binding protein